VLGATAFAGWFGDRTRGPTRAVAGVMLGVTTLLLAAPWFW
jgi:hypothetical protein